MDILSLHYDDSRRVEFQAHPEIFFNQELKSWIVFDPELVVELLRDDERLPVPNLTEALLMLQSRYKRQFPNLLFAAGCIPLLLEGQVHREVRRGLADLVSQGRVRTTQAMPDLMARYIAPLERAPNPEWIAGHLAPLVNELLGHMCGCRAPLPFPQMVLTRMFDRFVSLAALTEAEMMVGELRQTVAQSEPGLDPAHVVALLVLGRDSLVGALGTSLHTVLRQNEGRRFAEIAFPEFPPETGVAVADRIAAAAITVGTQTISPGERVRMYFQPISDAGSAVSRNSLFGAGVHSCLGRPISIDVWRVMIETLGRFSCRVASVACEYYPSNIAVVPRYLRTEHRYE